jgi:hypothetical protein
MNDLSFEYVGLTTVHQSHPRTFVNHSSTNSKERDMALSIAGIAIGNAIAAAGEREMEVD